MHELDITPEREGGQFTVIVHGLDELQALALAAREAKRGFEAEVVEIGDEGENGAGDSYQL